MDKQEAIKKLCEIEGIAEAYMGTFDGDQSGEEDMKLIRDNAIYIRELWTN